ncbi:hypothetical protein B0H19DRAFT_1253460 [Mycena capillaripes]|nr:hypothetical protein B0H19DRAFT_1253460 [Mycena capillaripes]
MPIIQNELISGSPIDPLPHTPTASGYSTEIDTPRHPLSIPPELLSKIFLFCLPEKIPLLSTHIISPSPRNAPLLTAQICGLWRMIALSTPGLWSFISLTDRYGESAIELLKLWSSRARALPLTYILESEDSERCRKMLEIAGTYHQQWSYMALRIPVESIAALVALGDLDFPILSALRLQIHWSQRDGFYYPPDMRAMQTVTISNAPQLRSITLSYFPHRFLEVPWDQVEDLKMEPHPDIDLDLLRRCTQLESLGFHSAISFIEGTPILGTVPTSAQSVTMSRLAELGLDTDISQGIADLLQHLTLPVLRRLRVSFQGGDDRVQRLEPFFSRSAATLRTLSLYMADRSSLSLFLKLAPFITDLWVGGWGGDPNLLGTVARALEPVDVLPWLKTLSLSYPWQALEDYEPLVRTLRARRALKAGGRAALRAFDLLLESIEVLDCDTFQSLAADSGLAICISSSTRGTLFKSE